MQIGRGRVIPMGDAENTTCLQPAGLAKSARAHVLPAEVVDATDQAARIIGNAEARAKEILCEAEQKAAELRLRIEAEARADAAASIAAHAIALKTYELRSDEQSLDRSIELAKILAERLLGESLRLAPDQIAALARQALSEARGARRIRLLAHPEDAAVLQRALPMLGVETTTIEIVATAERTRGSLRIETDIGVLDAELAPQLERLTLKLRESLEHG